MLLVCSLFYPEAVAQTHTHTIVHMRDTCASYTGRKSKKTFSEKLPCVYLLCHISLVSRTVSGADLDVRCPCGPLEGCSSAPSKRCASLTAATNLGGQRMSAPSSRPAPPRRPSGTDPRSGRGDLLRRLSNQRIVRRRQKSPPRGRVCLQRR